MVDDVSVHLAGCDTFEPAFGLHLSRHELNGTHISHDHDFWEIALVESGSGLHAQRDEEGIAERGHAYLLRPHAWHAFRDCEHLKVCNICWSESFLGRELSALLHEPILSAHIQNWRSPTWRGSKTLALEENRFKTILRFWEDAFSSPNRTEQIAHILLLLNALWREVPVEAVSSVSIHPAVSTCAALLTSDPERAWTLRELGQLTHLSSEHLAREFKRTLGIPPMEFLARERLERAAGLLLASDQTVSHIAQRVGYNDANFFARRFRAHFGISPREYRKKGQAV